MRLSLSIEQKLVQKQVLAPRMIQSMEILQLPMLALEERIEQEMSENPLLEASEREAEQNEDSSNDDTPESPDAPTDNEKELVVDESKDNTDDFERLLEMDREFPGTFDDGPSRSSSGMEELESRRHDAMANLAAPAESLKNHLEVQLHELDLSAEVEAMALRIVSSLDSNGYLTTSLVDLLPPNHGEHEVAVANEALEAIQSLDPPGVGARDLRECLLLQITPGMPYFEEVQTLVSDHLEDLRDNRMPQIQRKTGYSLTLIQEAWAQLRTLNPKPGAEFSEEIAPVVTPDVFLERDDDGKFKVIVEEGRLPTLRISNYYRQRIASGEATAEEREYIKRKVNAAQWLIESIEQRRNTLTRVSQAIVDHQVRFLEEGGETLEPLKMQQIADKVGVHVTTVSRAVDDKWIQTPRGIYPLKRFFVGGTTNADGEEVAWDTIRKKLQEVVDNEDKTKPFSDDGLVKELKKHGLNVARRTVTKYRRKMGIPSSRQRRDWAKIEDTRSSQGQAVITDHS